MYNIVGLYNGFVRHEKLPKIYIAVHMMLEDNVMCFVAMWFAMVVDIVYFRLTALRIGYQRRLFSLCCHLMHY